MLAGDAKWLPVRQFRPRIEPTPNGFVEPERLLSARDGRSSHRHCRNTHQRVVQAAAVSVGAGGI